MNSSRRSTVEKASAAPSIRAGETPSISKLLMPFSSAAKISLRQSAPRRRGWSSSLSVIAETATPALPKGR
jgi:hypothetical protein